MRTGFLRRIHRAARFNGEGALKSGILAFVFGAVLSSCASSVQRGAEFYMQRRYIDAAQVFEHCERQLPDWEEGARAEYALYRGATFLALGNTEAARVWLQGAQQGWRHLSPDDRALLADSLRAAAADTRPTPVFQGASGLAATPVRFSP